MGIVDGITCDGNLSTEEINYLSRWLDEHSYVTQEYPANVIVRKIREALLDKVVTEDEKVHLLNCLQTFSSNPDILNDQIPAHISRLFDDDPSVYFDGKFFVLTGDFIFGPRASCERAILQRGGIVRDSLSGKTDYLILGSRSSPGWLEENWGRKLQRAAELIDSGESELAVIREADWVLALDKR
jgi:NAD-dependent DNA ligase